MNVFLPHLIDVLKGCLVFVVTSPLQTMERSLRARNDMPHQVTVK
uniref:Uncharacterized protein n=1 Tax=Picea sitchensis TaxID=3332 RepID=D5A8P3_PICSI|nr:unknown [Picea sitchensis]